MSTLQSQLCNYTLPTITNRYNEMDKDTLIEHICNQDKRLEELNRRVLDLKIKKLDMNLLKLDKELEKKRADNQLSRKSQKTELIIMLDRMLRGY